MIHNLMCPLEKGLIPPLHYRVEIFTATQMKNDYGRNDLGDQGRGMLNGNTFVPLNFNEKLMRIYGYYEKSF